MKTSRSALNAQASKVLKKTLAPSPGRHRRHRAIAGASRRPKRWGAVERTPIQPSQVRTGPGSAWRCAPRGLTPRSSRAPTASHRARSAVRYILLSPGPASYRWGRFNSNVRPRNSKPSFFRFESASNYCTSQCKPIQRLQHLGRDEVAEGQTPAPAYPVPNIGKARRFAHASRYSDETKKASRSAVNALTSQVSRKNLHRVWPFTAVLGPGQEPAGRQSGRARSSTLHFSPCR